MSGAVSRSGGGQNRSVHDIPPSMSASSPQVQRRKTAMSFGSPNNPYGQPPNPQQRQPGYGYPQQPGYQQAPQGVPPQQGYGYPQQPGYQQQGGYGYPQQGYDATPPYANWGQRFLGTLVDGLVFLVP